jgi:hypothetical protein
LVEEMVAANRWPLGRNKPAMSIEKVHLPVFGEGVGVPFPCFGFEKKEGRSANKLVKFAEAGAREILGEMSDKEYLTRALVGTMPRLNRVFEEFRIHHEEHDVPVKVHKSLEDKAKKAATKNATAVEKAKKRKGAGRSKVISKKQKTLIAAAVASTDASAAASADGDEEVAENVGGDSGSVAVGTGSERSIASLYLGGDDFVDTALQGMGGGPSAEPFVMAPMPGVLGDDSSSSEDEGATDGHASLSKDAKADSADHHRPAVAPTVEVSEDEAEAHSPATPF